MPPRQSVGRNFMHEVTRVVQDNLEMESFGATELAVEMKMSRSNLHRRIKSVTGKSTNRFIREIRLQNSMVLLRESGLPIAEIAFKVGFGSASYFSKCFSEHFGFPPGKVGRLESSGAVTEASGITQPTAIKPRRKVSLAWVITFVVCIIAIGFLVIQFGLSGRESSSGAVIAVLPLQNDSPDRQNDYILNALLDEILNKLSQLDQLAVISRRTSETYRDSEKSIPEIGKELGAQYILEGSATILDQDTRIRLQLIEVATDGHLWSKPYEREITLENLFQIQEELALDIAGELRVVLNHHDKDLLALTPTGNPEAYETFILARELDRLSTMTGKKNYDLKRNRARQLLVHAIDLDSTFAAAYAWLGHLYIDQFYQYYEEKWDLDFAYACLDTGIYYVDRALSLYEGDGANVRPHDEYYYFALEVKGRHYLRQGMHDDAERYHKKGNRGNVASYIFHSTELYWYSEYNNYAATIEHYLRYLELKPEDIIIPSWIHYHMFYTFCGAGFPKLAGEQSEKILMRNGDSIAHYDRLGYLAYVQGDYPEEIRLLLKLKEMNPGNPWYDDLLIWPYACMRNFDEVIKVTEIGVERLVKQGIEVERSCFFGYGYERMGELDKARPLIQAKLDLVNESLDFPTKQTQMGHIHLYNARFHAVLGNKEKTMDFLTFLDAVPYIDILLINELKNWPPYDLVRETPQFRDISKNMETKHRKEHEKIARLLRKKGINPA